MQMKGSRVTKWLNLIYRHAFGLSQTSSTTQCMYTSQAKPWLSRVQTKISQIPIFQLFPDSQVLTTHGNDTWWLPLLCGCVSWVRFCDRLEYCSISYCTRERVLALGVSQLPFLNRHLLGYYSVYHPYVLPQAHGTTLGHFTIWTAQTNHTQPTVSWRWAKWDSPSL